MFRRPRGPRFDNEYEELATLGSGSFGEVIKVKHKNDGKFYAIKVIKNSGLVGSAKKEAETLANLDHANIVKYSDCFFSDMLPENERTNGTGISNLPSPPSGTPASVQDGRSDLLSVQDPASVQDGRSEAASMQGENMEVDTSSGQSSRQEMSRATAALGRAANDAAEQVVTTTMAEPKSAPDDPVPRSVFYIRMELCDSDMHAFMKKRHQLIDQEVWHVMRSLVCALEYLGSKNLAHGDIKLANVLLKKNDDSDDAKPVELLWCTVKLGDFGLAKSAGSDVGRPELRATFEQGRSGESSIKSDILSLGWVLLRMLMHPCDTAKWHALMSDALYDGKLPEKLQPRERKLLRTESGGMLHPEEKQRSDVAKVKKHMETWYKSRSSIPARVTAPL